jgi:hypothetical protein
MAFVGNMKSLPLEVLRQQNFVPLLNRIKPKKEESKYALETARPPKTTHLVALLDKVPQWERILERAPIISMTTNNNNYYTGQAKEPQQDKWRQLPKVNPDLLDHPSGYLAPPGLVEEEKQHRPVVIITSNSERELPEAFMRRCLYSHVEMPPFLEELDKNQPAAEAVTIERIVAARVGELFAGRDTLLAEALSLFRYLRHHRDLKRKPSLAELLNWLHFLGRRASGYAGKIKDHPDFEISLSTTLFKNRKDQDDLSALVATWLGK